MWISKKQHVIYLDLPSVRRLVPHSIQVVIPIRSDNLDTSQKDDDEYEEIDTSVSFLSSNLELKKPSPFSQFQLNDLIRDLDLSKEWAQLLGSWLSENYLLSPETTY